MAVGNVNSKLEPDKATVSMRPVVQDLALAWPAIKACLESCNEVKNKTVEE